MPYSLVLCQMFHPDIHGFDNDSDPTLPGHFLVMYKDDIATLVRPFQSYLLQIHRKCQMHTPNHPILRYYSNIFRIHREPHIAVVHILQGGESVAILKTFWIRLIQRAWKKTFKKRREIIQKRTHPYVLYEYQIRGYWPRPLPGLRGLLCH